MNIANDDRNAVVFNRVITTKIETNSKSKGTIVTINVVINDNRNKFYFVKQEKINEQEEELNYVLIQDDTIILNNYDDDKIGTETPNKLTFYFSTDDSSEKEYKYFPLFIQFYTEKAIEDLKNEIALKFHGKRKSPTYTEHKGPSDEAETETGVVYFPDIT